MYKTLSIRKAGNLALWLGNFKNIDDFYKYIQTFYCVFEGEEESYNPEYNFLETDYNNELKKIFSVDRKWKEEFKELFEEAFNRFEYDFGVTFDEDFQIVGNSDDVTNDVKSLFHDWQDLIEPVTNFLKSDKFSKPYNCFFGIPSCIYNGFIKEISNEYGSLEFIGNIEEKKYSTEIEEEYNI